jgi:hypothetical protein
MQSLHKNGNSLSKGFQEFLAQEQRVPEKVVWPLFLLFKRVVFYFAMPGRGDSNSNCRNKSSDITVQEFEA